MRNEEYDFKKVVLFFFIPFLLVLVGTYQSAGGMVLWNALFAGVFFGGLLSVIFGKKKIIGKNDLEQSSISSSMERISNNKSVSYNNQISPIPKKNKTVTKGEIIVENGLWECKICHIKMLIAGDYCSQCRGHKKKIAIKYGEEDITKKNVRNKKTVTKGKILVENGFWECKDCHIKMVDEGDYCSKCRGPKETVAKRGGANGSLEY